MVREGMDVRQEAASQRPVQPVLSRSACIHTYTSVLDKYINIPYLYTICIIRMNIYKIGTESENRKSFLIDSAL